MVIRVKRFESKYKENFCSYPLEIWICNRIDKEWILCRASFLWRHSAQNRVMSFRFIVCQSLAPKASSACLIFKTITKALMIIIVWSPTHRPFKHKKASIVSVLDTMDHTAKICISTKLLTQQKRCILVLCTFIGSRQLSTVLFTAFLMNKIFSMSKKNKT